MWEPSLRNERVQVRSLYYFFCRREYILDLHIFFFFKKWDSTIKIFISFLQKWESTSEIFIPFIFLQKWREYKWDLHNFFFAEMKRVQLRSSYLFFQTKVRPCCVPHQPSCSIMRDIRYAAQLIHLIEILYYQQQAAVRAAVDTSHWSEKHVLILPSCTTYQHNKPLPRMF